MRRTSNPRTALERIAPELGYTLEHAGKSVALARAGHERIPPRTTIRALAFLADQAMMAKRAEVRELVRWTGPVPSRGVKGWEEGALNWLKVEP